MLHNRGIALLVLGIAESLLLAATLVAGGCCQCPPTEFGRPVPGAWPHIDYFDREHLMSRLMALPRLERPDSDLSKYRDVALTFQAADPLLVSSVIGEYGRQLFFSNDFDWVKAHRGVLDVLLIFVFDLPNKMQEEDIPRFALMTGRRDSDHPEIWLPNLPVDWSTKPPRLVEPMFSNIDNDRWPFVEVYREYYRRFGYRDLSSDEGWPARRPASAAKSP